jgi:hypothetical protein
VANIGYGCNPSVVRTTFSIGTPLRATPSSVDYANLYTDDGGAVTSVSSVSIFTSGPQTIGIQANSSGSGITKGVAYALTAGPTASASYLGVSAEL